MFRKIFFIVMVLGLAACRQDQPPRLVVLLAVDHFSWQTYQHYLPAFSGGFKWLHDQGITFDQASHEHGYTATGPGHFVLGSGRYPGPAGLLGNSWYDRRTGRDLYCVEDPEAQALEVPTQSVSYNKIQADTFGDWLKASSPASKVFSVACKDRAAILMGGKHPDLAVWYNWRGAFTTTDYYTSEFPAWLKEFNAEHDLLTYRDSIWDHSRALTLYAQYAHADSFYGETDRFETEVYSPVLPIGFEPQWDEEKIYNEVAGRPWMDRITLELASRTIAANQLGMDDAPDVLAIGLSTMDLLAHYYGPYSHETMDHLLRLDEYLQDFINTLDEQVGLEHVVFALSTDHGGMPLPEHWTQIMHLPGGRVDEDYYLATRAKAYAEIDALYGSHDFILRKGSSYYYDQALMDSMGVDADRVNDILQSHMESVEGVHRLYTKAELLNADDSDFRKARLRNFMHPELSPDLYTLVEPGWLFRNPFGTSHSTPYDYDSHVPFIIARQGMRPRTISEPVSTADIAPTLAGILGVRTLPEIDGKSVIPLMGQE